MKISLLHPSRGRSKKSANTIESWLKKSDGHVIEVIISVDSDDDYNSYINEYSHRWLLDPFGPLRKEIIINPNISVVEATNHAAKVATGDILIYVSDDFDCPEGWDQLVINEFKKYQGPALVKVDDCLQPFTTGVLTIPMMNRSFYNVTGYFWHPDYLSMHVDEDLYWTAVKLLALRLAPHLKFTHEHHSLGKAVNDETYRRSESNWNQGKATFARRKAAGFPL